MEVYTPTFSENNNKARAKFRKIIELHVKELKQAFDEYLNSDTDKSERRELELEQYLHRECDDKEAYICNCVMRAIHEAFPKPPKPVPEFVTAPLPPIVKSEREAREKGYRTYVIIEKGPEVPVPEALKDPNIQWTGHSITPIIPVLNDTNHPARMTYEGETYYRDEK